MSVPSVSACVPIEEIKSQGAGCGRYGRCMTIVLPLLSWVLALIKPTEQGYCHDGAINLQCITNQVVFATHLPRDVIECLWHFCFTVYMCETLLIIIVMWMLKNDQHAGNTGTSLSGFWAWRWRVLLLSRLWLYFFKISKFSVAVLPHLTQNLIHMFCSC